MWDGASLGGKVIQETHVCIIVIYSADCSSISCDLGLRGRSIARPLAFLCTGYRIRDSGQIIARSYRYFQSSPDRESAVHRTAINYIWPWTAGILLLSGAIRPFDFGRESSGKYEEHRPCERLVGFLRR